MHNSAGPVLLDNLDIALMALCLLINGALSFYFKLGLGKRLLIAGVRTVVQLLAVGYVLVKIFSVDSPLYVLGLILLMGLVAGYAASKRVSKSFKGLFPVSLFSIILPAFLMTSYAVFLVVQPSSWWDPRYLIPLAGMVLGNTLTAVSLVVDRFVNSVIERWTEIESLLCLGADTSEALIDFKKDAIRTGMTPMLNAMMVVGIVTLPGMMTGQILGGTSPDLAVRYQILIMFLLAGTSALASMCSIVLLERMLFAPGGRLRRERILQKNGL